MQVGVEKKKWQDLEERALIFATRVREFLKKIPKTIANVEYTKQLIRSSSSIAANYIEANESLGKKDWLMRIKICRKEAKESRLWLRLCDISSNTDLEKECQILLQEAREFLLIFSAIIRNTKT